MSKKLDKIVTKRKSFNPGVYPEGATSFYINTKKKKSFYKKVNGCLYIFNKGLEAWEKTPNITLDLLPISQYSGTKTLADNSFDNIEEAAYTITDVKLKTDPSKLFVFRTPPITIEDMKYLSELYNKHTTPETLGFVYNNLNYYIAYDHNTKKWICRTSLVNELFTFYTSDLKSIQNILLELNQPL